ncbi:hypothetical protein [Rhodococcus daqingensis]|uniref:Uncharacterized protein n=1 Tax=Rhodococcus daqingensis TaxID=2479363 RepID=A0ABW2RXA2_9NOCA
MSTALATRTRALLLVLGAAALVAVGGGAAAQADVPPPPPPPECLAGPHAQTDANGCLIPPKHQGSALAPERLRTVVPGRPIAPPPRQWHDPAIVPRPPQQGPGCGGPLVFCP